MSIGAGIAQCWTGGAEMRGVARAPRMCMSVGRILSWWGWAVMLTHFRWRAADDPRRAVKISAVTDGEALEKVTGAEANLFIVRQASRCPHPASHPRRSRRNNGCSSHFRPRPKTKNAPIDHRKCTWGHFLSSTTTLSTSPLRATI